MICLKETPNPHYILREFLVHHEDVSGGGEEEHVRRVRWWGEEEHVRRVRW